MAVSTIPELKNATVKTFTFNSLQIEIYVFPSQLRVVKVYTNSAITQAYTAWTNVGAYIDGLSSCTVVTDGNKLVAFRGNNGQLQIYVPASINNQWVVGTAVSVA